MTLAQLLAAERAIWEGDVMSLSEIAICLGVIHGDICREARDLREGKGRVSGNEDLKRELGNLISSTVRWCDDLGYSVEECVNLALEAQRKYPK